MSDEVPNQVDREKIPALLCPKCGEANITHVERCWLCGATLSNAQRVELPKSPAEHSPRTMAAGGFSLASLMLFMTLACVLLGVISIAPGIGIPLAVVAFAAWTRTNSVVRVRAVRGPAVEPLEKIRIFMQSLGVTVVMLVLVCVAAGAAFFTACTTFFAVIAPNEVINSGFVLWILFSGSLFVGLVFLIRKMIRLNRARWRRDIGEPE